VTPTTLLWQVAPLKAIVILLCAPTLDRVWFGSVMDLSSVTNDALQLAAATCGLAVVVNIAQFSVIKYYGAGLFQAMSQLKTAFIIYGGSLVLEGTVSLVQGMGTLISVLGTYLLMREKQNEKGATVVDEDMKKEEEDASSSVRASFVIENSKAAV